MTLHEYIEDMRGKRIAIIGIGVSNTPLLKLLLAEGIRVTACDKRTREQMGQHLQGHIFEGTGRRPGASWLRAAPGRGLSEGLGRGRDLPHTGAAPGCAGDIGLCSKRRRSDQ